ncbi:MAG: hypothetical protein ACRD36_08805, partial [Candidatus Acidiferrum sp.]
MANIAQLDLSAKSGELRLRALLEDMVEYHKGVYPENKLVLAVWFGKGRPGGENNLLELFNGLQKSEIVHGRYSLLWK